MLTAHDITVNLAGRDLVKGACLQVESGELVGLLGPNGAGKSTLLRALAGVIRHSGDVQLQGTPAFALTPLQRARLLAYLPQERRVEWAISVREVVALGRHPHQRGTGGGFGTAFARQTPQDDAAIAAAMTSTGIADLAGRSAKGLSGGELARVLLARALAVDAPMLLADEPVAALDPFQQLAVMDILRARAHAGTGVLVVLHDLTLAARFCDRVIVMDQGGIRHEGHPADVLVPQVLEEIYHVMPLIGDHAGERWLVPWKRSLP